ncbi:hypothetical protein Hanom_Chr04g00377081 [Helianthus anomalus]
MIPESHKKLKYGENIVIFELFTCLDGSRYDIRVCFFECFRLTSQNSQYGPPNKIWILFHYL